jgi:hypothetical protein
MKYTGVSKIAVVLVWFRNAQAHTEADASRRMDGDVGLRGLVAGLFAIAGLVMLIDWALHG